MPPTTTTSTTTTTTAAPEEQLQTYQLTGGWVRIRFSPGSVTLDGAGPAVGFTMDVRDAGPSEVDVRFDSDDHESRFSAEWEDGALDASIEEEDD